MSRLSRVEDRALGVRQCAVAGFFYPATAEDTRTEAEALLAGAAECATPPGAGPGAPKAIITPHAGWRWSGALAALAWSAFAPVKGTVTRVVLLGPTHRVAIRGIAAPQARAFASPLGALSIPTQDVLERTAHLDQPVILHAATHAEEHALEVQVPFIQLVLGDVELVPLNVGAAAPSEVADVIEALWGGEETVLAVSSDLSHYLSNDQAHRIDSDTINTILTLDGVLDHDRACGASPVNGLLEAARRRHLTPRLLGAHTSGDVGPDQGRVVGYAAIAFDEEPL